MAPCASEPTASKGKSGRMESSEPQASTELKKGTVMESPRCHSHKDRAEIPRLCYTCQRIAVEQEIVTKVVDAMLQAGYCLQTDVLDDPRPTVPTSDRTEILAEMMAVDDEFLGVYHGSDRIGWVRFVYGNDGWDVVSDYTTNLESALAPINAYADTLC